MSGHRGAPTGERAEAAGEERPAAGKRRQPRPAPPFGYRVELCLSDGVVVVARTKTYVAALRRAAQHGQDRRVARLGGRLRVVEEAFGTVVAARRLGGDAG
jgi:hypothetical protein